MAFSGTYFCLRGYVGGCSFDSCFEGTQVVKKGIDFLFESSGFLIVGSLVALVWANMDYHGYEWIVHNQIVHFLVNNVLMAFFFAIAAKEIREAFIPGGALSSPRKAMTPILATVGGMVGPALIYVGGCAFLARMDLMKGWAIPCATDIAFSYLVAKMVFGPKHPAIPFLLLLAIVDDGLGLIILATCYPTDAIDPVALMGLVALGVGLGIFMKNVMRIKSFWAYIGIAGSISWLGFYHGGIHPALGLVPVIFVIPHAKVDVGLFEWSESQKDTLNEFEHWFKNPVELILGAFGLVNAGVALGSFSTPTMLVLAGLLIGKPLGITLFALIGMTFGLTLPEGMSIRDLITIGVAASVGFTVALFVSTVAFPAGETLEAAKMGALGSFVAFVFTIAVGKILRVKEAGQ